jgi:hypothetical protein
MRVLKLIPVVAAALFLSSTVFAQVWSEYVNRENFFTVNFPDDPTVKEVPYKTAKGTDLTARTFTAEATSGIQSGTYTMTVVDYNSATDEIPTAIEEAAKMIRAKGDVKYEGGGMIDNHRSYRLTVETPNKRRILAEILVAMNNRLYISEADTAINVPPPAQYQASVQILDENGVRIRYRSVGSTERVR